MQGQTIAFKTKRDLHITRKLFHFLGVMFMVACLTFLSDTTSWFFYFTLGGAFIAVDLLRQKSRSLNKFAHKFFGPLLRESEANKLCGVTFLVLGSGLTFFIFEKDILILSLLFLGVGDPIASFVGVKYGTTKIFGHKSIQGSLAAFVACTLACLIYCQQTGFVTENLLLVSIIAGFTGMVSELIPVFKLDDNFTQPLLNGAFLTLIFQFFGGL